MEQTAAPETVKRRRTRRARKRVSFKRPARVALPVRALWELASEEQRAKAHEACSVMLEYWLGRITRQQAAERLSVPTLRIWQLGQQALSGMLAGLLKQPRRRAKEAEMLAPEDDPKRLKKKVEELERELEIARKVIELLRDLPGNRDRETKPKTPAAKAGKKRQRRGRRVVPGASPKGDDVDGDGPSEVG